MGRFTTTLAAIALAGSAWLAAAAGASAAPFCPADESFFGTIQRVNGNMLTVSTKAGHWADVRIDSGAKINTNGGSLRPGAYAGLYGCVTQNGVFHASEVTLAASPSKYRESLTGVVDRVESGRIIVRESGNRYGTWYVPDSSAFRAGEQVNGVGMIGLNGAFYPQSVNSETTAYDPDDTAPAHSMANSITLTGVVQKVSGDSLLMWEPAARHSGTWIVRGAAKYRVGERLVATGTEDTKGHFYPQRITIQ